jgi:tyrosinase
VDKTGISLSRRALLRGAATGLAAGPLLSGGSSGDPPGDVLRYNGRTIRFGHNDAGGAMPGAPPIVVAPDVRIDDDPLHVMPNGDGTFSTAVHHHRAFPALAEAARAAVDELQGARLTALPHQHPNYADRGAAAPPVAAGPVYTRRDHRALPSAERRAFVAAVLELKRSGRYDEFVRTHVRFMTGDKGPNPRVAHHGPSFLPWHRRFLLEFESALRAVDPTVSLPFWDWTADRGTTSALWSSEFLGGDGRDGDGRVMTGPFAYANGWRLTVGVDDRPFLRRRFGASAASRALPSAGHVRKALAIEPYDAAPWDGTATRGFRNQIEGWRGPGLHNRVHDWAGGTMTSGASPNDPMFWLHHCFIDSLWARWRAAHPGAGYLPAARTKNVVALDEPMPPWNDATPRDMLDHTRFYRYA